MAQVSPGSLYLLWLSCPTVPTQANVFSIVIGIAEVPQWLLNESLICTAFGERSWRAFELEEKFEERDLNKDRADCNEKKRRNLREDLSKLILHSARIGRSWSEQDKSD